MCVFAYKMLMHCSCICICIYVYMYLHARKSAFTAPGLSSWSSLLRLAPRSPDSIP